MIALLFLLCISGIFAWEGEPKIIIIGSGAAGIGAATELFFNDIKNFKILEAEDRIGGRVNSTKFGNQVYHDVTALETKGREYMIDLGAQWVHGENNAVFQLAWPLGLLSKAQGPEKPDKPPVTAKFYSSTGSQLTSKVSTDLFEFIVENDDNLNNLEGLKTGSVGEMMTKKLNEYFDAHKDDLDPNLRESLIRSIELVMMAMDGAVDWNDVSANGVMQYTHDEGFLSNNWKERSYSTIFDIILKKIPTPTTEIPIMEKIMFNKKVTKIKYDDGPVKVTTADGDEYEADHVICTVSLGVLKADHEKLFDPPLPEKNTNSVKNLGFGHNAKIFLSYDEPWWSSEESVIMPFFWTPEHRKEIENDPEKSWLLGISYALKVEWKPNLLFLWMSGPYCEQMEKIPDEPFKNLTIQFVEKFFGNSYNVTEPKEIIRSHWNTNENFRGTYSYPSITSGANGTSAEDLGLPIMRNNTPMILFAGEATEPKHYGTVHGAMATGVREADRLINFHSKTGSR